MHASAGIHPQPQLETGRASARPFGFYSALLLAMTTVITFAIAVGTPPISGPFATGAAAPTVVYPYLNVADRFPRDYYWMVAAMVMLLVFVAFVACVDVWARPQRKVFGRMAMLFGALGAGVVFVNYYVQLSVVQPSLLNQEQDGISLLTQYNPHGLFIALEEAGFLLMSLALCMMAPIFAGAGRLRTALTWTAAVQFVVALATLAGVSAVFGLHREYLFEVYVITILFLALVVVGILAALLFRRTGSNDPT